MIGFADISVLSPPLAFVIVFATVAAFSFALSGLSCKTATSAHSGEAYACGEDLPDHLIKPDYGQFLPFAFFFTILHVMALMATTVPVATPGTFFIALVYLLCAVLGLFVIYAR